MEPMYVDNLTTAYGALFAFYGEEFKNDENFRHSIFDTETEKYRRAATVASNMVATLFNSIGLDGPDYLHIWVNKKNQLMLTYSRDAATRDKLVGYCKTALRMLEICPVSQEEARGVRG